MIYDQATIPCMRRTTWSWRWRREILGLMLGIQAGLLIPLPFLA